MDNGIFDFFDKIGDNHTIQTQCDYYLACQKVDGSAPDDRAALSGTESAILWRPEPQMLWVAGAVFYSPVNHENMYWVDLLYVEQDWRRKGVASGLFEQITHRARADMVDKIEFGVMVDNEPMKAFAAKLGYGANFTNYKRVVHHV